MTETKRCGTWGEAVLGGLPHLFFALVAQSAHLAYLAKSVRIGWNVPMLFFFALIALVLIFAWQLRWPRWSATWVGYGLVMVQLVPLGLSEGYTVQGWISSQMPIGLANLFFFAQIIFSFWIGLGLAGRDRPSGLLAALPAVPALWSLIALDRAPAAVETILFIGSGLVTALAAAVIVRTGQERGSLIVALTTNLLIVFPTTCVQFYYIFYQSEHTVLAAVLSVFSRLVLTSVLVTGPLWGWWVWEQCRQLLTTKSLVNTGDQNALL